MKSRAIGFFLLGIGSVFSVGNGHANASSCLSKALAGLDRSASTAHAFDFYKGTWSIRMRQRKIDGSLKPSSPWMGFPATVVVRSVLQGTGFTENYTLQKADGAKYALGTRLYNPKTNTWAIYWANMNDGQWQSPAVGGAMTSSGIRIIYDDTWGSRAILTRYEWATSDPNHPRWEQSFSGDCGSSWITNWTMDFTRTSNG